jgi:DNA-binding IclR family transcriptional regulator
LIRDANGDVVAGLSVSAPIERRKNEWAVVMIEAAAKISERLGYQGD